MTGAPRVLMIVGAYPPEVSGGALQIRSLIRALGDRARCAVLTTTAVREHLPSLVDGVAVNRVPVDVADRRSMLRAAPALARAFVRLAREADVVQFNGFSRKTVLLMLLAALVRARCVVKLTSVGDDDPPAVRARSRLGFAVYRRAEVFIGVSPRQRELCLAAGVAADRFTLIPNGVDTVRFRPAAAGEGESQRLALGLDPAGPVTLFVGFFSRDKQPDVAFDGWAQSPAASKGTLVLIGATQGPYREIDPLLADGIRARARAAGLAERVAFVERTEAIERYYRAADAFVMPSLREGLPNALLEAMASGLPCVVSRLPGVTDWVVEDGVSGLLVPPGDAAAFARGLERVLAAPAGLPGLGAAARRTAETSFSIERTAAAYAALYARLARGTLPASGR